MLLLAVLLIVLWAFGERAVLALRYDRLPLADGEWWRLLTGHLVHGGLQHLLLNLAGLAVIVLLFPNEYSPREWFLIGLTSALAIGAGLWWLSPEVSWYVGLSGVLHGVLAAGALAWWRSQTRLLAGLLTAVLVVKLGWEHWQGGLGWSGNLPTIVNAHLYGALGGGLAAALLVLWHRRAR